MNKRQKRYLSGLFLFGYGMFLGTINDNHFFNLLLLLLFVWVSTLFIDKNTTKE